jgi:hypothetical protein
MRPGRHTCDGDGWLLRLILDHFKSQHLSVELGASNEQRIYREVEFGESGVFGKFNNKWTS